MVEIFEPEGLNLTEGAVEKIRSLSDSQKSHKISLRVFVTGGGCSGFQYGFTFAQRTPYTKHACSCNILGHATAQRI